MLGTRPAYYLKLTLNNNRTRLDRRVKVRSMREGKWDWQIGSMIQAGTGLRKWNPASLGDGFTSWILDSVGLLGSPASYAEIALRWKSCFFRNGSIRP